MSCVVGSSFIKIEDKPNIVLTLRDANYKRTKKFIEFYPYFYIGDFDYDKLRDFVSKDIIKDIRNTQNGFRGIDGFKLRKITVDDPHDISEINKQADGIPLYESNIQYHYRWLIDNNITTGIDPKTLKPIDVESKHKIAFIDIEVLKDSAPDYKVDPITIIGMFDYLTKKYYSIYVGCKYKDIDLSVIKTPYNEIEFIPCKTEQEMLEKFASVWLKIEPDIIVSFSTFDMEYIVNRLTVFSIDPKFLSPIYNVRAGKGRELKISNVHIVDFAEVYRKIMGEPVWNTLGYIAQEELGYGKLEVTSFVETYKTDKKKLIEYNLRDVELLNDLENEIGVLSNYLLMIWKLTGLDLIDCLMPNSIGDILHIRHVKGKVIFPSKSTSPYIHYEGAYVGGKIGLHKNIGVLDWNELYPTIMEMFHISLDSFDLQCGDIQLPEPNNVNLNAGFTSSRPGWTIEIMKPLRAQRQMVKKTSKTVTADKDKRKFKLLSQAIKVVINALYGLYGQKTDKFTSRFYDARIANAICLVGRILNVEARKIVEEMKYEWVYYDTDSLFIKLQNKENEMDILKATIEDKLRVFLKEKYNVTSLLRLDYEYTFTSMLVIAKKKYIGLPIGSTKSIVKGLRIIQKNTSKITVIEEEKVGRMRMADVPVKDIKAYINTKYHRVKMGMEPLEDIIIKARISKKYYPRATSALKATIYAKERYGIDIPLGQRFYWLYIHPPNQDTIQAEYDGEMKTYPANIIAFPSLDQLPKGIVIDYKKMADVCIKKPLAHYIEEATVNTQSQLSKYW